MRLIIIIAVGERKYGDMALNTALSIKAQTPEQKILLVYEPSAIKGIEELTERFFDYAVSNFRHTDTAVEFAFWLKTQLYGIATGAAPEATEFIYLDADTIMLPSKNVNEWFEKHKGRPFTAYCNDIYDYKAKKRKRRDYTFWCDPEKMRQVMGIAADAKMPQINTSFLYFEKCGHAKHYFEVAANVWDNDEVEYTEYKGAKPDELCFNIASALTGILPHQNTYRPIFFQFGSEQQNISYIYQYYKSFGFAGEAYPHEYLIKLYNETCDFFRQQFGIFDVFKFKPAPHSTSEYLSILPIRRTLYRRGEVENSEGGIFNPDATLFNGELITIYRKEAGIDKSMYIGTTAIPMIESLGVTGEIKSDADKCLRLEDFRLFEWMGRLYCNHTVCSNINTSNVESKCGLSKLVGSELNYVGIPELPVKQNKVEKNWVFFAEQHTAYCVYSLQPYKLFKATDYKEWTAVDVVQPELKWLDKSFISNSTNPILIGESYLMFFHSKDGTGGYHHGAVLIDAKTKNITHCTPRALNIQSGREGLHPKITYVSGSVYFPERDVVRVYIGESDSHAIYNEFNATRLIKEIKKYKV